MHEFSIAASVVDNVLEFANANQIGQVLRVRLVIGELTCVQKEQLSFCYSSLVSETAIRDSELEIETVAAQVKCGHCLYEGAPKYWDGALANERIATMQCPQCGNTTEAIQGHECAIRTIQYVN